MSSPGLRVLRAVSTALDPLSEKTMTRPSEMLVV